MYYFDALVNPDSYNAKMDKMTFWAILAVAIISMILFGMISSAINRQKAKRQIQQIVGELPFKLEHSQHYHLILSSGKRYENNKILGMTEGISGPGHYSSFLGERWLVLELLTSKRVHIKESRVSIIEEA